MGQNLGKWGVCFRRVFEVSEKGGEEKCRGKKSSSSPPSACAGEEEDPQCHSKRHRLGLFF